VNVGKYHVRAGRPGGGFRDLPDALPTLDTIQPNPLSVVGHARSIWATPEGARSQKLSSILAKDETTTKNKRSLIHVYNRYQDTTGIVGPAE
jgi:hypothetical protein